MKEFVCEVCGYIHKGIKAPDKCPDCDSGTNLFTMIDKNPEAPKRKKQREKELAQLKAQSKNKAKSKGTSKFKSKSNVTSNFKAKKR